MSHNHLITDNFDFHEFSWYCELQKIHDQNRPSGSATLDILTHKNDS